MTAVQLQWHASLLSCFLWLVGARHLYLFCIVFLSLALQHTSLTPVRAHRSRTHKHTLTHSYTHTRTQVMYARQHERQAMKDALEVSDGPLPFFTKRDSPFHLKKPLSLSLSRHSCAYQLLITHYLCVRVCAQMAVLTTVSHPNIVQVSTHECQ